MSTYVFAFRNPPDQATTDDEEAAWSAWFTELGAAVVDFGHRVVRARLVGDAPAEAPDRHPSQALSGYVVIEAANFEEAVVMAKGCPGLRGGGLVEVGEVGQPA